MMANNSATSPAIDKSAPIGSSGLSSRALVLGTSHRARMKVTAHTGTLMRNTEPHPKRSTSSPPTTGPMAIPMPATPAHTPIARARSAGSRNVLVRIDRVVGKMNAPPTPMRARAAMSIPGELAVDASAENTPNHASPNNSVRRRPYRSPIEPAVRSRHAKTIVYASTIHCSCDPDASSARTIDGSATLRIVLSTPITTTQSESTPRTHHRRSWVASSASERPRSGVWGGRTAVVVSDVPGWEGGTINYLVSTPYPPSPAEAKPDMP